MQLIISCAIAIVSAARHRYRRRAPNVITSKSWPSSRASARAIISRVLTAKGRLFSCGVINNLLVGSQYGLLAASPQGSEGKIASNKKELLKKSQGWEGNH